MSSIPQSIATIPTPALILDATKLERNVVRVNDHLKPHGVQLRPHLKTCKSIDVARIALAGHEAMATVSTLKEAEYFFDHGITDLMYAVGIVPSKLPRVAALLKRGALVHVILDDEQVAEVVADTGVEWGVEFSVFIELDVDGHRSGVNPNGNALLRIAERLRDRPGARLTGVMTHAGESYEQPSVEDIKKMSEQERRGAVDAAERLRTAGHDCPNVSIGSSPTAALGENFEGVTEVRCGVCVFWDLFQSNLGVCRVQDIALTVLTTVIGHQRKRGWIITDAGSLALSKDRGTANQAIDYGFGQVCNQQGQP